MSCGAILLLCELCAALAASHFINDQRWFPGTFNWQDGYGAFSYSPSHVKNVINYIANQEERHKKRTFKVEYLELLKEFEIEYKEEYLFKDLI